jgi:heme oxygenase (biliverdin-producing, ferredoxin)
LEPHTGGLPQRLKAATREWHARAERSGVMGALLAGAVGRDAYVALLANLRAIYGALEAALGDTPRLAAIARGAALDADLLSFGGTAHAPLPQSLAYAARLQTLRGPQGHRLWAHVYVRYLGDLHGGQLLARRVRALFGDNAGTRFYDYGSDERVLALRADLRTQLASLVLGDEQADEVVAEAVWAFEAHCRLFEQIAATK